MPEAFAPLLTALEFACGGTYRGTGRNHAQETFAGTLKLETILGGRGFQLRYLATASDGTLLHAEHSLLAPDENGNLCLWNFNTNAPGLLCHRLESLRPGPPLEADFRYGDFTQASGFREQVSLRLDPDGSLGYTYAWGLPGDECVERSGVILRR